MCLTARVSVLALVAMATGCAVHTAPPLVGTNSFRNEAGHVPEIHSQFMTKKRPSWATELAAEVSLSVPGSDGTEHFDKQFCEIPRFGFSNCPYKYGLSDFKYKFSKTLAGIYADSASAAVSGESRVGRATFSQADSLVSTSQPTQTLSTFSQSFFAWVDWVTPTSRTLPNGTQVTFQVTLALSPSIVSEPCLNDVSTPEFDSRASGSDGNYGGLEVEGQCEGITPSAPGSFVFRLHNAYHGPIGNTDIGTVTAYIDEPFQISGSTYVLPGLCATPAPCPPGNFNDELAGKTAYSIKSLTA